MSNKLTCYYDHRTNKTYDPRTMTHEELRDVKRNCASLMELKLTPQEIDERTNHGRVPSSWYSKLVDQQVLQQQQLKQQRTQAVSLVSDIARQHLEQLEQMRLKYATANTVEVQMPSDPDHYAEQLRYVQQALQNTQPTYTNPFKYSPYQNQDTDDSDAKRTTNMTTTIAHFELCACTVNVLEKVRQALHSIGFDFNVEVQDMELEDIAKLGDFVIALVSPTSRRSM